MSVPFIPEMMTKEEREQLAISLGYDKDFFANLPYVETWDELKLLRGIK